VVVWEKGERRQAHITNITSTVVTYRLGKQERISEGKVFAQEGPIPGMAALK
jgi:hypothetical protein